MNWFKRNRNSFFLFFVVLVLPVFIGYPLGRYVMTFEHNPKLTLITPSNCKNVGWYEAHGEKKYRYECQSWNGK